MILNNNIESPYNKFPTEGPVPIISKSIVKSKLSNKFSEINEIDIKSNFDKFKTNFKNQASNLSLIKDDENTLHKPEYNNTTNLYNNHLINDKENSGYQTKLNNNTFGNTSKSNPINLTHNRIQSSKVNHKRNDNQM